MKLTESQLRSIIRKQLIETMVPPSTPEFGEDSSYEEMEKQHVSKISKAIEIATSLQTHLSADEIGNKKLGELVGILHEIEEAESGEI